MFILCGCVTTQYAHGIFLNTVHTTIFSYINHFTVSSVIKQDIHTNAEKNIHTQYCIQYISFYKIQRLVFLVLFKFMQHRLSKGLSPRFYPINLSTDEEISWPLILCREHTEKCDRFNGKNVSFFFFFRLVLKTLSANISWEISADIWIDDILPLTNNGRNDVGKQLNSSFL